MGREAILKSVKENKPTLIPLPEIKIEAFEEDINVLKTFKEKVALVGGSIVDLSTSNNLNDEIRKLYPNSKVIVDCFSESSSLNTFSISKSTSPTELANIDLAIVKGEFGVAENGAVWVTEEKLPLRILSFIANDLVIVVDKNEVYLNMHHAYSLISKRDRSFGVFIAGPSKTADIEQCLVIGAQGAMSLTVVLI